METREWAYEQTSGLSEGGGVERMISSALKAKFDSVLSGRQLAEPAINFTDPDFFDEVPLYARYNEVDFLKEYGDVNLLLIELSLDYLERVASQPCASSEQQFVAITVISDDENEYIVPSIFVCNRDVITRLKELHLSASSQGFGQRIKALVKEAERHTTFSVLEDRCTVPDDVRVFISYQSPPGGFVGIHALANGFASPATSNL